MIGSIGPQELVLLALQLAVVHPLLPAHDRDQGQIPHTADAVPIAQRLEVGAVETVLPLAEPQTPFIGVMTTVVSSQT